MIFTKITFVLFFIFCFTAYWFMNHRAQNIFLLVASYIFYGSINIKFPIMLFFQTLVTFYGARLLDQHRTRAKMLLTIGIAFNLIMLGYFKYFDFFADNINSLFELLQIHTEIPILHLVLPLGISFYTLHNIGYLADVYRQTLCPCNNVINYGLYISFFPKLIAGPIERGSHFLSQINTPRIITLDRLIQGFLLLQWGYFQKRVIADNIAPVASKVFLLNDPSLFVLCTGIFAYTIYIFADFSGYTDIARGLAMMLGFTLSENFRSPYFARSPSDFWRRWHISFSTWIRDYIYIPLSGSRCSTARWAFNLFVAFLLTGLWHGSAWHYIMWGLYYWILYLLFRLWKAIAPSFLLNMKGRSIITIPFMFILINIGWYIFRENNTDTPLNDLLHAFSNLDTDQIMPSLYLCLYISVYAFPLFCVSLYQFAAEKATWRPFQYPFPLNMVIILTLFVGLLVFRRPEAPNFIYFNF